MTRPDSIRGLDELQAAILRVKLKYLDQENARRKDIARIYDERLAQSSLRLPQRFDGVESVYHQYVTRCDSATVCASIYGNRAWGRSYIIPSRSICSPLIETECHSWRRFARD